MDDCGHSKVPQLTDTISNPLTGTKIILIDDENQNQKFLNQIPEPMNEVEDEDMVEMAKTAIEEMHEHGMMEGEKLVSAFMKDEKEVSIAMEDLDAKPSSALSHPKAGITSDLPSPPSAESATVEGSKPTIAEKVDNCIIC